MPAKSCVPAHFCFIFTVMCCVLFCQESFSRHTDPLLGKVLPFLYHLHHTRLVIPLVGSENLACGVIRIEL